MYRLYKLLLIFCLTCFIISKAVAQEKFSKPDFGSIEKIIKDPNSIFYYPKMLKKYFDSDTSLTDREYYMLYFGHFFQDHDNPLGDVSSLNDSIRTITNKSSIEVDDWKRLIPFLTTSMNSSPFTLSKLFMLHTGYEKIGDKKMEAVCIHRLRGIVRSILSTGDGLTESTAYYVLQARDEYSILSVLGYKFGGSQSLTDKHCDYLTVKNNDEKVKGIYFDVNQIFEGYSKMFKMK